MTIQRDRERKRERQWWKLLLVSRCLHVQYSFLSSPHPFPSLGWPISLILTLSVESELATCLKKLFGGHFKILSGAVRAKGSIPAWHCNFLIQSVCYIDATPSSWSASMLIYTCYYNGAGSSFQVYHMYLFWQF